MVSCLAIKIEKFERANQNGRLKTHHASFGKAFREGRPRTGSVKVWGVIRAQSECRSTTIDLFSFLILFLNEWVPSGHLGACN